MHGFVTCTNINVSLGSGWSQPKYDIPFSQGERYVGGGLVFFYLKKNTVFINQRFRAPTKLKDKYDK